MAGIVKTAFVITGAAFILSWAVPQSWIGIGFISGAGPPCEEPTLNVFLKAFYWVVAALLFYWAFEVFVVLAVFTALLLSRKAWGAFLGAVREKGFSKGVFVGIWRIIPVLFEPLFFNHLKRVAETWMKESAPEDPSLRRYLQEPDTEAEPVGAPLRPKAWGDPKKPTFELERGRAKPDLRKLKEFQGKKGVLLPSKTTGDWGMKPGKMYLVQISIDDHHSIGAKGNRVNDHWDMSLRHPIYGFVVRVVSKESRLPELGKPILAIDGSKGHGYVTMNNPLVIPEGYGRGTSKVIYSGEAIVWIDPQTYHLHMYTDNNEAFAFPLSSRGFLMVKMADSPKGGRPIPHFERKMVFKDISRSPEKLAGLIEQGYVAEAKIDGSFFWVVKDDSGEVYMASRKAMVRDGKPVPFGDGHQGINRAAYIPGLYEAMEDVPKGTMIAVEVFSPAKGTYGANHTRTAALLNMNLVDSLKEQNRGGKLVLKELSVYRYGKQDVSANGFKEDYRLRLQIKKQSHGFFHLPKHARGAQRAEALWREQIENGGEGLVLVHETRGDVPRYKLKVHEDWDFKMTGIGPIDPEGRSPGARSAKDLARIGNPGSKWLVKGGPRGAGYIEYKTEHGAIGKAGSGLTDEQRIDLWENPEKYLGKGNVIYRENKYLSKDHNKVPMQVQIRGMSRSGSGVVRAPVIERFRDDK